MRETTGSKESERGESGTNCGCRKQETYSPVSLTLNLNPMKKDENTSNIGIFFSYITCPTLQTCVNMATCACAAVSACNNGVAEALNVGSSQQPNYRKKYIRIHYENTLQDCKVYCDVRIKLVLMHPMPTNSSYRQTT